MESPSPPLEVVVVGCLIIRIVIALLVWLEVTIVPMVLVVMVVASSSLLVAT